MMLHQHDPSEQFYQILRENILTFLYFLFVCVPAYLLTQKFQRQARFTGEDDDAHSLLPKLICVCCLTLAFITLVFIPVTVMILCLLPIIAQNDWLYWLDADLLSTIARYAFFGNTISLFGLVPFAYFYLETDLLLRSFVQKSRQAIIVFLLVSTLVYTFISVLQQLFGWNEEHAVVLHWGTFITTALLSIKMVPKGALVLFKWIHTLPLKPNHRQKLRAYLTELKFERNACQQKLDYHLTKLRRGYDSNQKNSTFALRRLSGSVNRAEIGDNIRELRKRLVALERQERKVEKHLNQSPLYRNTSFVVLFTLNTAVWFLFVWTVAITLTKNIFSISESYETIEQHRARVLSSIPLSLSQLPLSRYVVAFMEFVLVVYFVITFLVGCYESTWFSKLKPKIHNTSTLVLLTNTALLLLFASALPILVPILGLTDLDLMELYPVATHTFNDMFWINAGYRLTLVILTSYSVLEHYLLTSATSTIEKR
ncbi:hypothetical protein K493DRAFT_371280 [Basidiobolus meristosporus CBS 931.73]|uniref:Uncharacterized protein n=1 Tax=Basidiobolus meristosporus CBS 931.73 TaxID=1314790 RepID=A0A1Y1Z854_9FUNG|nr:hypothetical protein K493DRAFT_371280 [Basidiobolus meristosporus CBS 931.73]|eukprot:ORY06448.1 hypothetical protein K493DRAFT_371280 [Basidiobolus meristosporus CBS 931.73]